MFFITIDQFSDTNKDSCNTWNYFHVETPVFIWIFFALFFQKTLPIDVGPLAVNCCAFNHNGQLLIVGAVDGAIRLFGKNRSYCLFHKTYHYVHKLFPPSFFHPIKLLVGIFGNFLFYFNMYCLWNFNSHFIHSQSSPIFVNMV